MPVTLLHYALSIPCPHRSGASRVTGRSGRAGRQGRPLPSGDREEDLSLLARRRQQAVRLRQLVAVGRDARLGFWSLSRWMWKNDEFRPKRAMSIRSTPSTDDADQ